MFKVIWGHLVHLSQMGCSSKTAGSRVKQNEIWNLVLVVVRTLGAFNLLVFKVVLGSFGAVGSKWPVSGKRLAIEGNRLKFGNSVVVVTCI